MIGGDNLVVVACSGCGGSTKEVDSGMVPWKRSSTSLSDQ